MSYSKNKQKFFTLLEANFQFFKCNSNFYATFKGDMVSFLIPSSGLQEKVLKLAYQVGLLNEINGKHIANWLQDYAADTKSETECKVASRVNGEIESGNLTIFIKLNQKDVLRLDGEGSKIINEIPESIKFISGNSDIDIPKPNFIDGFDLLKELKSFINYQNENDLKLIVCYIIYSFFPADYGSKPILVLGGEQGSGKSNVSKFLKNLIDPSSEPLLSIKTKEDLYIACKSEWLIVLDNLSTISNDLSDVICKTATGTAYKTRLLFTNGEPHSISTKNPLIINGIGELISREDLADRCIQINLAQITSRKSEVELNQEFESKRAKIFGAGVTILSKVLHILPHISSDHLPRMADFAKVGIAVEKVLGWQEGEFLEIYNENRRNLVYDTLENNILGKCIMGFMQNPENQNKFLHIAPTDLYKELRSYCDTNFSNSTLHFPKTPEFMGKTINRLIPHMRNVGVIITCGRNHKGRFYSIIKI